MIVADLSPQQLQRQLKGEGLRLRTGPVVTRIRTPLASVADGIALHYARHPVQDDGDFIDFQVSVQRPATLRRWVNRQVVFRFDGATPFTPLPGDQGFPMLEWGLNWCVSAHCHQFLVLHAAVLERDGNALILPAPSGSGKSTLAAGLAFRGWRLLSDELTLIDPASGRIVPLPRPISLKNASIAALRAFAPEARFGRVVHETIKGAVAHVQPPPEAVQRAHEWPRPRWIVLPRWREGAKARFAPLPKAHAFMQLVDNAFNYNLHGREGFRTLAALVDGCDCREFTYTSLADASAEFERLAAEAAA